MVQLLPRWLWRRPRSARQQGDDARAVRAWARAESCYARHLESDPSDRPIWVQLGHALKEQGKLEPAMEAYTRAVRLDPDDLDARAHLEGARARAAASVRRRPRLACLGWLRSGEHLAPGEVVTSRDGGHELHLTTCGEVRLERRGVKGAAAERVWSSRSSGRAHHLEVTPRGRLIVVDVAGAVIWAAEHAGPQGSHLRLTDAGALLVTNGLTEVRLADAPESADPPKASPIDVDLAGELSLVVQGPLVRANLVETARRLEHWRALFPAAQIIFAISSTNLLEAPCPGPLTALIPVEPYRDDGSCRAALAAVMHSCDQVVLAGDALPLPPFKDDSGPNNFNLQLSAARAGLGQASGRWCLRIRSDAVFATRDFLTGYAADAARPRGPMARFTQRILVSPIFSLNPFTIERMPLHVSDWFHFGLLDDVRRLWDVPPMSFADATYYRTHTHAPGSNAREAQFISRLAVEQHLVFQCFRSMIPELHLRYNNDRSSVNLAMRVWSDNFALCDLMSAHFHFEKYVEDQTQPESTLHCLTRGDWVRLVDSPDVDAAELLADKTRLVTVMSDLSTPTDEVGLASPL